jgi:hypothetical protein
MQACARAPITAQREALAAVERRATAAEATALTRTSAMGPLNQLKTFPR